MSLSGFAFGQEKFQISKVERIIDYRPFENLFDGRTDRVDAYRWQSRWESHTNNDWATFTVDLGAEKSLSKIIFNWEAAGGKIYDLSFSSDNVTFSDPMRINNSEKTELIDEIPVSITARYIKFAGVERGIGGASAGYSAWEMEVYDSENNKLSGLTAVSELSRRPIKNMFDGDLTARWESLLGLNDVEFIVDLGSVKNLAKLNIHWEGASAKRYFVSYSSDKITFSTPTEITGEWDRVDGLSPNVDARYIKIECKERMSTETDWDFSIWEFEAFNSENVKYENLTGEITSLEVRPIKNMIDGNMDTRWESVNTTDLINFYVDLGSVKSIENIKIHWEAARADRYRLRFSNDNITYSEPIYIEKIDSPELLDDITTVQSARYIRFEGLGRKLWGCCGNSIFEFEVYGTPTGLSDASKSTVTVNYEKVNQLISFTENIEHVTIYNAAGMMLKTANDKSSMKVNDLSNGIYILRFVDNDGAYGSFKFIK